MYEGLDDPRLVYTNPSAREYVFGQASKYPVLKWVVRGGLQDFRPGIVKQMLPDIDFLRVPFPYQNPAYVCWAFKTHADRREVFGD
jgi:hypothetical protein